jgi:hypothetical protein
MILKMIYMILILIINLGCGYGLGLSNPHHTRTRRGRLAGWLEIQTPPENLINHLQACQLLLPTFNAAHCGMPEHQKHDAKVSKMLIFYK